MKLGHIRSEHLLCNSLIIFRLLKSTSVFIDFELSQVTKQQNLTG